ncbi:hypothetical protein ARMGADRAFT_625287 [Armillaria gallica]|uniref:Uncharacterized protein n=1 Tax=Armillaria gallica TaxID=47427 RepID=A0A2H3DTH3_ARMGA|nr:hypothetical protein ARMGADRAFT_625287 [Armillaria gallica]
MVSQRPDFVFFCILHCSVSSPFKIKVYIYFGARRTFIRPKSANPVYDEVRAFFHHPLKCPWPSRCTQIAVVCDGSHAHQSSFLAALRESLRIFLSFNTSQDPFHRHHEYTRDT